MKTEKLIVGMFAGILLVGFVFAQSAGLYCCEKTTSGAWCQNTYAEECSTELNPNTNSSYKKAPTSCQATSYCRMGCCFDSEEGTCMENTPQRVCAAGGGVWEDDARCEVPQCELGCCVLGDQASFVTLTRCKRLSNIYGLENDFRTDIEGEVQCILSTTSDVVGACVFEKEFERTCSMITKAECLDRRDSTGEEVSFHEGFLCSATDLATNCGKSMKTTCVEGVDEVFFIDTCGNIANVYDSTRIDDPAYWEKIVPVTESCGYGASNADSATCGNCDYFLGSTCKSFKRGEDKVRPDYGDNICRDLSCEYQGVKYQHGETFCINMPGVIKNLPGSRYFRGICYNGDVTIEPCADFRNEICLQDQVNGFRTAGCIVNKWQDCVAQKSRGSCLNTDRRDCIWLGGGTQVPANCVPKYSPGLDFWSEGSTATKTCATGKTTCTVEYEEDLFGKEDCTQNCECKESRWQTARITACKGIGDCGPKKNYLGIGGGNAGYKITVV